MKLLLDTCALLWMLEDSPRIGPRTRKLVEDSDIDLSASAASILEIAIKARKGRLDVSGNLLEVLADLEIPVLSIDPQHAWHVSRLPDSHADPFDRVIAVQAILGGRTVVTVDLALQRLGARLLNPEA